MEGSPAKVFLKRTCPIHGEASVCIASDARFYWLAKGRPENDGACCVGGNCGQKNSPSDFNFERGAAISAADGSVAGTLGRNTEGQNGGAFEKLSTCLALIEIVNSCNLACPTCYADSPVGIGAKMDAVPPPV